MAHIDGIVEDYLELRKRLPGVRNSDILSALILAASNERAAGQIAQSINDLELELRASMKSN